MASHIGKDKLDEVRASFEMFDKNSDGKITKDELKVLLDSASVPFTPVELDEFFKKMDTDGSGYIDYNEFCAMMNLMSSASVAMEEGMKKIFTAIDQNSDAKISHEELRQALSKLGQEVSEQEALDIINTFDRDNDGQINFDGPSYGLLTPKHTRHCYLTSGETVIKSLSR